MFSLRKPTQERAGVVQISAGDHGGKTPRQGQGFKLLPLWANLDSNKTTCKVLQVGAYEMCLVPASFPCKDRTKKSLSIQN